MAKASPYRAGRVPREKLGPRCQRSVRYPRGLSTTIAVSVERSFA